MLDVDFSFICDFIKLAKQFGLWLALFFIACAFVAHLWNKTGMAATMVSIVIAVIGLMNLDYFGPKIGLTLSCIV